MRHCARSAHWQTDHFSLYSLILEEKTPLYAQVVGGRLSVPDEDATADMYERAIDLLGAAGYTQYEISNWAKDENRGLEDWRAGEHIADDSIL